MSQESNKANEPRRQPNRSAKKAASKMRQEDIQEAKKADNIEKIANTEKKEA